MNSKKITFPIAVIFLILQFIRNFITIIPAILNGALNLYVILNIFTSVFLIFALIKKDRSVILLIAITLKILQQLISFSLLGLLEWLIIFIVALSFCEQTIINFDFSKIADVSRKIFYLPAVISIISTVIELSRLPQILIDVRFIDILNRCFWGIINAIFLYLIALWLINPYEKEKIVQTQSDNNADDITVDDEAYCSLGKHIVLCLFTFGIWYLIWTYRTTKFLNKAPNVEQYNPTNKLLLCIFVPFYQIYWFYKHGQKIDSFSKYKKLNNSDMATICLILGIFIPLVACILMQDRINAICVAK